ncbi:hypothetical protein ABZ553_21675 [Streptomyces sparsogenes]
MRRRNGVSGPGWGVLPLVLVLEGALVVAVPAADTGRTSMS